jgi:hypothetical protein
MKSRVEETTPPSCCPTALLDRGLRGFHGLKRELISQCRIRVIRVIRGSIIPLVVIFCALQFSSSAKASATAASPANSGCAAAQKGRKLPKQNRNVLPDSSPNDLDDADGGLDDVSATTTTRHDQDTPWFTTTTLNTIALHEPGFVPAFLFSTHSSDSPREHIRERAPPPSRRSRGVGGSPLD